MLNDEIKASDDYSEYVTKSLGTQPAKGRGKGKGLITKKDLEVSLNNIRVPKKRHSKIVFKESAQSEGVENDADSEETEEEDEIPLVRRQTGIVISSQAHQESDEESLDHSKKLKGVERMSETIEFLKGPNKGSGVTPVVLDEPSGSLSSSSLESDDEIKDIFSDEDDKATKEKDVDEQAVDDQLIDEQAEKVQVEESIAEPHVEKTTIPHPSSNQTLSSVEYGNQFILDNPDLLINDVLKEPVETKVISMVEVPTTQENPAPQRPLLVDTTLNMIFETTLSPKQPPQTQLKRNKTKRIIKKYKKPETQVDTGALDNRLTRLEKTVHAMSRFNIPEEIDKSVQAHLKKILQKDVPDFGKIKVEKVAEQSIPKSTNEKKRKQKDSESSKDKDQASSSKKGKSLTKSSKSDKSTNAEDNVNDAEMDAVESIKDVVVNVENPTQADASVPKQDMSKWFNTVVVERPESRNPE
ncbi:hypothetical protein Tco_0034041 [Tanacetum coccineum]